MDRADLYEKMALRKDKPKDYEPYDGNNGRVNKCFSLMKQGKIRIGGTLLDIGGGIGDLCYAAKEEKLFERVITLDISETSLGAAAAKGIETIRADVDKNGFAELSNGTDFKIKDNSVDTITALDFIEHIIDPENFARECYRVLKPCGEVFINTPNIQFWQHLHSQVYDGVFPHTSGDKEVYHGGHLSFLNYRDIKNIFVPAGFSEPIQFMDEEGYKTPPSYWVDPLRPRNQNEFQTICLRLGCPNLLAKVVKK